ncbi:hypothetical protein F3K43_45120 [Streptomyces sp. LBUM 1476]|nr:hypothetical protein [Streptomyces sp. LBUM 1476]
MTGQFRPRSALLGRAGNVRPGPAPPAARFFHASYKKPRESNGAAGAAMFLLTFLAVFMGTVLKWRNGSGRLHRVGHRGRFGSGP